jgi:hypothetical protein
MTRKKFFYVLMASVAAVCMASLSMAAAPAKKAPSPPTPRLANGTVDLGGNGIWNLPWITDFGKQIVGDKSAGAPFLPWTRAMHDYNASTKVKYDPEGFCLPPGGPRSMGTPYPAQFIQQKNRIIIIFEGGAHVWREIYMDGRSHPPRAELNPTYFGHSTGKWDKDTLVIDTVGYNERTWLDFGGHMHTEDLHTIERITRPNRDTLHYETWMEDPGAYTKPWTVAWDIPWSDGQELTEYICQENNQFMIDLRDDFGEPFFQRSESAE